jgi:hypothetical protein
VIHLQATSGPFLRVAASSNTLFSVAAVLMTLPLVLVFMPTLFASFYVSYRDVFSEDEGAPNRLIEAGEGARQDGPPSGDGPV